MNIPKYASTALEILASNNFEGYLVGGCVRDFLMNITPHDFDITTNALPSQLKQIFSGFKTILSGEKHGTVGVIIDGNVVEITTYRTEAGYSDNRHPESVEFSTSIEDDLKRRDFTINAMAMDIKGNIIDLFDGKSDLNKGIIRAVGNPTERFEEDALRIMRALRFAARLGFTPNADTAAAIIECRNRLKNISAERIRDEFSGLICGKYAVEVLRRYRDVIAVFIPELKPCFDFDQKSPWHKYDVWEHTLHALGQSENSLKIRLSVLLHDIAKPDCFKQDENGRGHFKHHAEQSAVKAKQILSSLKYPKRLTEDVTAVIFNHRDVPKTKYEVKKLLSSIGKENTIDLIALQRVDSLSKQDFCRSETEIHDNNLKIVEETLANNECLTIKQLDISGHDLIEAGFEGRKIGQILNQLLEEVLKENLKNEKNMLKKHIEQS